MDFRSACPPLLIDRPRYDYERATLLRSGVLQRLLIAAERLPSGCRLSVIEGWRSQEHQRQQYLATEERFRKEHPDWSSRTLRNMVNRFSAPPEGSAPAPHTTGGAVDLWLCDANGDPLDLYSPYDAGDPRSFSTDAPGLHLDVRRRRSLLRQALEAAGLTGYPCEYWHWSYGDQGWAYRDGHSFAIYGPIHP